MKIFKKIPKEFFRIVNRFLFFINSDYKIIKKGSNEIDLTTVKNKPTNNIIEQNQSPENQYLQDLTIEQNHQDYWIIMPLSAFGDSLVVLKLTKEFKKIRGGKVLIISNQERILKLAKMFPDVDKVILISNRFYQERSAFCAMTKIKIGRVFSTNFYLDFIFNKTSRDMLARSRDFLEIKEDIYGESPLITEELTNQAIKIIDYYGLENKKIVLITPLATTMNCNTLSFNFWFKIARTVEEKGYKAVFNGVLSQNNGVNNQGFATIFSNIDVIVALSNFCHSIIGIRSGLLDVIRDSANARMFVIYNHNHSTTGLDRDFDWDKQKSSIENYIKCCSLKTMYKNNNTVELIYSGNEDVFEQEIINHF